MKVRELLARLQNADPDFLIVIDAASQSLLILNPKPGFCDPAEIEEEGRRRGWRGRGCKGTKPPA